MVTAIKLNGINRLMIFVLFVLPMAFAVAEKENEAIDNKPEVLTTLEQRMAKRISVNFRNTPIDDVIRIMAEQADVDIVKSPEVVGEVTTTLTDVPLSEALSNILTAHGFGYVTSKNMIRVAPLGAINERIEAMVNRIYRITYADVAEVETALKKFISSQGSISANLGTSNVIVTDIESKIKAIDTFIAEIDRITPQIVVEARIYDIKCTDRFDLGIQWQAGRNTTIASALGSNPTAGRKDPFLNGAFSSSASKTSTSTGTLRIGWLNSGIDIDMILKAQQENLDAKLLANPRVLVLDNEKALFRIISEIPYQELTETSDGGSIGSTSFREVGVTLEVVPHITRDEMIRLHLVPEFSVKSGEVALGVFGTDSSSFNQPIIDRRFADTTLLIKNGQTVVLGGLRKKQVNKQVDKVPLLGDIPVLDNFFKFNAEETIVSELVVFVTPWIVEQPVLTEREQKAYEVTDFKEPEFGYTNAEVRYGDKPDEDSK